MNKWPIWKRSWHAKLMMRGGMPQEIKRKKDKCENSKGSRSERINKREMFRIKGKSTKV